VPRLKKKGAHEVIKHAYNLKTIAQFLACIAPRLLEAALGFYKLVLYIKPLLEERIQLYDELTSKSAELEEVQSMYEKLETDLRKYTKREEKVANWHSAQIRSLEKKIGEAEEHKDPLYEGDVPITEESLATLDKLSFPMDDIWKEKNMVTYLGEGSHGLRGWRCMQLIPIQTGNQRRWCTIGTGWDIRSNITKIGGHH
jgi:hypothetical protein